VKVAPGAEVRHSILLHDTVVEAGTILNRVIADKDVRIGSGCQVGVERGSRQPNPELPPGAQDLTVLGKGCQIGAGVHLLRGIQVYPDAVVDVNHPGLKSLDLNLLPLAEHVSSLA